MIKQEKFKELMNRLKEIDQFFLDQNIIKDQRRYQEKFKERRNIEEVLNIYKQFQDIEKKIKEAKTILKEDSKDEELVILAKEEIENLDKEKKEIELNLRKLLVRPDPDDDKNAFMELRAGTGGEESAIFVADLFRMYQKYCEKNGWKIEIINSHASNLEGFKELILLISGKKIYFNLKYEKGVHRVQRIPQTESQGRIHTSAVTVAILPEAEESDIYIDNKDLRIDAYRASGAGGQHVNKTDSAIRITHIPTGLVVTSQDQRSQYQNKMKAMQVLRAKLYEKEQEERNKKISQERKSQIGTGDRSEKIRTYNYPQNRVTEHRINLTLYKLDKIMDGDLDEITSKLQIHFAEENS